MRNQFCNFQTKNAYHFPFSLIMSNYIISKDKKYKIKKASYQQVKDMNFNSQFQFQIFTRIFSQSEVTQIVEMTDENIQKFILLSGKIYYQLIHSRANISYDLNQKNQNQFRKNGKRSKIYCQEQSSYLQAKKNSKQNNETNFYGINVNEEETYFLNYYNILKAYKIKNIDCERHKYQKQNSSNNNERQCQNGNKHLQFQKSKTQMSYENQNDTFNQPQIKNQIVYSSTELTIHNMQMHYLNMKTKSLLAKNLNQNKLRKKCKMLLKEFVEENNLLHKNFQMLSQSGKNIYDFMLLGITFSNLGFLYQKQNKPYKSLPYLIKAVQYCFKYKNQLKQRQVQKTIQKEQKNKLNPRNKQVRQTVIVLVNCLALTKSSLRIILNQFQEAAKTNANRQNFRYYQQRMRLNNIKIGDKFEFTKNNRQLLYIELNEIVNYLGYRYSIKYLGNQSHFTKKFIKTNLRLFQQQKRNQPSNSFEQNIFNSLIKIQNILQKMSQPKQQLKIEIPPQKKVKRQILLKPQKLQSLQLQSQISHHINQNNHQHQPEHYQTSQYQIQKEQSSFQHQQIQKYNISVNNLPVNSIQHSNPKNNYQSKVLEKQSVTIGDWILQVQFCRILNLNCSKKYLRFQAKNVIKKIKFSENIQYQKLMTILTLVNLECTLPYEYSIENLSKKNFISYCILPYINIEDYQNKLQNKSQNNQNKKKQQKKPHMVITPMNNGLQFLSSQNGDCPLQIYFFGIECFIFFNHIRSNNFRICISPKKQSKCIYLNLFLDKQKLLKYFEISSNSKDFTDIFKENCKTTDQKQQSNKQANKNEKKMKQNTTIVKILDEPHIINLIKQIIKLFQVFLAENIDQTSINQILNQTQNYYFQFRQKSLGFTKGTFFKVYFNQEDKLFQIYAENTFKSYGINQRVKTKGHDIYTQDQLQKQFGISFGSIEQFKERQENQSFNSYYQQGTFNDQIKNSHQNSSLKSSCKLISELICQKYDLIYFQKPLSQGQKDQYNENSIFKYEIASQSFHTEVIQLLQNDYEKITPISICLMVVNNQIPIGLKIQSYDLQKISRNQDFCCFIYIWDGDWQLSAQQKNKSSNRIKSKPKRDQKVHQSTQTSNVQNSMFIDHILDFTYKTDYFIDKWLKKEGFRLLFETILFQNGRRQSFEKSLRSDSKSKFGIRNIKNRIILFEEIADQLIQKVK